MPCPACRWQIKPVGAARHKDTPLSTTLRGNVQLNSAIQGFLTPALSQSTQASYSCGIRAFSTFALSNDLPCVGGLPVTLNEELFIYFATHCSINLGLAYTTIKLYLCGIRNIYFKLGKGDPFMIGNKPMLKLQLLLKGIKKARKLYVNLLWPVSPLTEICYMLCAICCDTLCSIRILVLWCGQPLQWLFIAF